MERSRVVDPDAVNRITQDVRRVTYVNRFIFKLSQPFLAPLQVFPGLGQDKIR